MRVPSRPARASASASGEVMSTSLPPLARKSSAASILGPMLPGGNCPSARWRAAVAASIRRSGWAEAKRISPPRQKGDPSPLGSPERTLILRDGTALRGDLVESVLGDHTTLRMPGGDIRRASWSDIKRILVPLPAGGRSPIPTTGELVVTLDTGARVVGEYFEYTPEQLILRHPSGRLHVIPVAAIRKVVVNGDTSSP